LVYTSFVITFYVEFAFCPLVIKRTYDDDSDDDDEDDDENDLRD